MKLGRRQIRKKILTKDEKPGNIPLLAFSAFIWNYLILFEAIPNGSAGERGGAVLALLAGAVLIYLLYRRIMEVRHYRRIRRQCMKNPPQRGVMPVIQDIKPIIICWSRFMMIKVFVRFR